MLKKSVMHHIRSRKVKMYNNTSGRRNEVDDVLRTSNKIFRKNAGIFNKSLKKLASVINKNRVTIYNSGC